MNTIDMVSCAEEAYQKADAELNAAYKQVIAEAETEDKQSQDSTGWPGFKDSIQGSQRAWVAFRDKECDLKTLDAKGGSLRQIEYPRCQEELTRDRIRELEKLFKD